MVINQQQSPNCNRPNLLHCLPSRLANRVLALESGHRAQIGSRNSTVPGEAHGGRWHTSARTQQKASTPASPRTTITSGEDHKKGRGTAGREANCQKTNQHCSNAASCSEQAATPLLRTQACALAYEVGHVERVTHWASEVTISQEVLVYLPDVVPNFCTSRILGALEALAIQCLIQRDQTVDVHLLIVKPPVPRTTQLGQTAENKCAASLRLGSRGSSMGEDEASHVLAVTHVRSSPRCSFISSPPRSRWSALRLLQSSTELSEL